MHERADSIGAELEVVSAPGSGTTVRLSLPSAVVAPVITVVVADDHDLLREGVSACLATFDDITVIAEASSGEGAVEMAAQHSPDVVVVDLVMPGIGGLEAIRRIREAHPRMGVLALSSFYERERVQDALDAGADGYLVKSVDAESLAHAVRSVARGQGAFSPEVDARAGVGSFRTGSGAGDAHRPRARDRRARREGSHQRRDREATRA